jgi:hypothetical protein
MRRSFARGDWKGEEAPGQWRDGSSGDSEEDEFRRSWWEAELGRLRGERRRSATPWGRKRSCGAHTSMTATDSPGHGGDSSQKPQAERGA